MTSESLFSEVLRHPFQPFFCVSQVESGKQWMKSHHDSCFLSFYIMTLSLLKCMYVTMARFVEHIQKGYIAYIR